jgi:flagellar hook-associated protein 1 FlgK
MSGFIGIGLTGLLAAQRALQVAGNNIANANTDGYVRQRIDLAAVPASSRSSVAIGQGVRVAGIERVYDQLLTDQLRDATAATGRSQVYNDLAVRLDRLLGDPERSITTSLRSFFGAIEAVGRDPTSIAARQQLLLEAGALGDRFAGLDNQLGTLARELDARLDQAAATVNRLTAGIAQLNTRIVAAGGSPPAELVDQREQLLRQLAGQVDVATSPQADGSITVFAGSGQTLVVGPRARELSVASDPLQADRLRIGIREQGSFEDLTGRIGGGAIGGMLAFRRDVLDPVRAQLGQVALGVGAMVNEQHRQGLDLNGALGGDFFRVAPPGISASTGNTGTATVAVAVTAPAAVAAREYELRFNGSAWTLYDRASSASIPATGSGTPADPLQAEGLSLTVTGSAAAGDRFLVRPLGNVAANLRPAVTDPARIAAASPLAATALASNLSDATPGRPVVSDATDPGLLAPVEIRFESASSYRIWSGAGVDLTGPQPWTAGDTISFNGWSIALAGTPAAADRFSVRPLGSGSGDNGNAIVLSDLGDRGYFRGGAQSLTDLSADLVGTVGAVAARAASELEARQVILSQATLDVESVSGVNLEEEAAAMLRFQQAYQAATKILAIGDELFQTLLLAIR